MHPDIDLSMVLASDITDTVGAAKVLTERFERNISVDTIHGYVRTGLLPAYVFQDGKLVPRNKDAPLRGKDLIFLKVHLVAMKKQPGPGNPNLKKKAEETADQGVKKRKS